MSTSRIDPAIARPAADNRAPDLEGYTAAVIDGVAHHAWHRFWGRRPGGRSLSAESHSVWHPVTIQLVGLLVLTMLCAIVAVEAHGFLSVAGRVLASLAGLVSVALFVVAAAVDSTTPPPVREKTQRRHLPGRPDERHPLRPHHRATGLIEYVEGKVWVAQMPLVFYGMQMGARMVVVKLSDGSLVLYSPLAMTDQLKTAVTALGKVKAIVAPNMLHHLFVGDWMKAFPGATTYAAPGLEKRRKDLSFSATLTNDTEVVWDRAELDFHVFQGHSLHTEVVLFAVEAKTLIVADLIENLGDGVPADSNLGRFLGLFGMYKRPTPPTDFKLTLHDPHLAGESAIAIGQWDFEQIVLAHGALVEVDAKDVWNDAFAFAIAQA